jgi:hypothetical protein
VPALMLNSTAPDNMSRKLGARSKKNFPAGSKSRADINDAGDKVALLLVLALP